MTESVKDIIFPKLCPICKDAVPFMKRAALHFAVYGGSISFEDNKELYYGAAVCGSCMDELSFINRPYCSKCGKQLAVEEMLCSDCWKQERSFVQCRSLLNYDETARELMADIKYNHKKEYIEFLAMLAADRLGMWIRQTGAGCIVPVPVHESRLASRGYNQSGEIARLIGGYIGMPVIDDALRRRRKTEAQKELTSGDRMLNLQTAFEASMQLDGDPAVLLVDDIYTTGATLEACSECLKEAGAKAVYGLCICAGADA